MLVWYCVALHSLDRDVTVKMSAGVGRGLLLVQRNKHDLPLASNGRVVPQPNSQFDDTRQNDQNISLQSPRLVNRSGCETAKRDLRYADLTWCTGATGQSDPD